MKIKRKSLILTLLLPLQIVLVLLADNFPDFIEKYYSNGIYPIISKILRILFGWIPYSAGDLLIFVLLLFFIRFLVLLIKNKFRNFLSKMIDLIASISIIYFCFYVFWGLNYYRNSLADNLNLDSSEYSTEELIETTKFIIDKTNEIHFSLTKNDSLVVEVPYSSKKIYELAPNGFDHLEKTFPQLSYSNKSVKSSLMSLLQTYNGTAGYFNPLTGEAQVNDKIPLTGYASTTCHEMAHQLGWAAENEANFIGFLASIHNDDLYFQYSGYRMATRYLIVELNKRDRETFKELYQLLHFGIRQDFKESSDFWLSYKNPFEPIVKKGYNAYLKANNQSKGIASYNYVVDLLISYHQK